jgi:hypothetical protein
LSSAGNNSEAKKTMSVQYEGKSPNKLWYFWQNTKALARTPFEYTTQRDARKAGKDVAIFIAAAAATSVVLGVPIIAALPVLPSLISIAGSLTASIFAWQGFQKIRALKNSSFVYGCVRESENKWLHRKADGNVFKRGLKSIKDKISSIGSKIPLPLIKGGKWLGIAAAAAGAIAAIGAGLSYAGIPAFSTGATATTILGSIAQAGAVIGLSAAAATATVTGLALLAIPVGLAASAWCRKTAYTHDPNRPVFKKPSSGAQPIDRGQVFSSKAASFEFNANSSTATPVNDDALTEQRKKAAEQRANNRKRGGNSNRFT